MTRPFLKLLKYRVSNTFPIAAQPRIPKPQCLDAAGLEEFFMFRIEPLLFGEAVVAAVQFDVQFSLFAEKSRGSNCRADTGDEIYSR